MKKVSITSQVVGGKITNNRELMQKAVEQFNGRGIKITIEESKPIRSNNQNSYLWVCVYPILREGLQDMFGEKFSLMQCHDFCKQRFNYTELVHEETGEIIKIAKSTTENNTKDQEIYHEEIRRFALDYLCVTIPLPNENLKLL